MNHPASAPPESIPVGQFLFYTGWGMWEILSLPAGKLP